MIYLHGQGGRSLTSVINFQKSLGGGGGGDYS